MTLTGLPIPEITNLPLYLNIAFFAILGMGMLIGFLRGFKNSLYSFIVTVIFYVVFFLTIDLIVNQLWSLELSFLGGLLANLDPAFQSVTSLSEAVPLALSIYVPDIPATVLENANLLEFIAGLGIFVVKIAYTIIYFTVIQIIYRLLTFIIRIIFFNTPKGERKYRSKNRVFGALFGLMSGVLSLFITLIIFGGIISITESIITLAPEIPETEDVVLEYPRQGIYQANYSVIPLQQIDNPLEQFGELIDLTNDIVSSYNENILVGLASQITIQESETESEALNIYLFDSVLSFSYKEEKIAIRDELSVYAGVAGNILNSEFMETQNLADIDGELIQTSMDQLADSHLFTSLLPLAVDVGSDMLEVDIPIDKAQIYAIDWKTEVMQIGEVAALVFDFINTAGLLEEDPDLETIVFDGDSVRNIFDALGDSQLVTLAAYVALEPVLAGLAEDNPIKAIITVPEGLVWKDEFIAMGEIIGAILDTQITYAQIQSGDPMTIIQALAQLDFTVILDSKIITHALINVLQGAGGMLDGEALSFLVIPDDILWLDELDGDGNIIQNGELRNILLAINQIAEVAVNLDFNNLTAASITELTDDAIDALFESQILIASITETVKTLDFGELALLIPDEVYDDDGYLIKTELIALVGAIKTIVEALPCDDGDEECATIGFDYGKVLTLESATIDEVFESLILEATIGNMVIEMGAEVLVIPENDTVIRTVMVEGIPHDIVTGTEIKRVFAAASVFEFENIDDLEFDETMILDIASDEDKIDTILESEIIAATAGSMLYEMGEDALTIPAEAIETITVGGEDETIVIASEIRKLLLAVATLEISTLEGMEIGPDILKNLAIEDDDTVLDEDKADQIFDSVILQATISNVLIDLAGGETQVLSIPYFDEDDNSIRYRNEVDDFDYISVDELKAIVRAILVLDITDFEGIDIDTLDFDNIIDNSGVILASAILQATISDQIIGMDTDLIVVPDQDLHDEDVKITTGEGEQATTFIARAELERALEAIQVLNLDLQNPAFDETIINNLASESDPEVLDDTKLTTLLDSTIIHASMSKMIIDLAEGDGETEAVIIVPYYDEAEEPVRIEDGAGNVYVSKTELINLFKAYYALDITDFTQVDSLEISTILEKFDTLILSATLHATISDQVINLEADAIVIPEYDHEDDLVVISVGEGLTETTYIRQSELRATFDALEVLNIDYENPAFDATMIDNLAEAEDPDTLDEAKLDDLFDSMIIHASISKMLLDLAEGEEAVLQVPYLDAETTAVRFDDGHGIEYVSEMELRNALKAMHALDISDFNNVETLDLDDISANFDVLIESAILHATISDQVVNMESDAIVIPEFDHEDGLVIISVGEGLTETTYIDSDELRATFDALEVMNIDFNNPVFDATIINNLAEAEDPDTLDEAKLDTLFDSMIIHASISKMLFDLTEGEEAVLQVPYFDAETAEVRFDDGHGVEYVSEIELRSALKAMHALDISDFNNVETLGLDDISANFDLLIASAILHATISDQVINMESDAIVVPEYDHLDEKVIITVGALATETTYIDSDELRATFDALEVMNIDFNNPVFDATMITNLAEDEDPETLDELKLDTLFDSMIIHASISKMLFDLTEGEEAVMKVPYYDADTAEVRFEDGHGVEYVSELELRSALKAMHALDISDFNNVENLTLGDINANFDVLIASAILHATISDQLLTLESDDVSIPYYDYAGVSIRISVGLLTEETVYIDQDELENTFIALALLGVDDLNTVDIDIDLTDFYDPENRDTLMASAIVHSAISKQLVEVEALSVPYYDIDMNAIRVTRGSELLETDTEYVADTEIHALFEVLQLLNIETLDNVAIDLDLTNYYDPEPRETLMASASVHLEISNQLFGIGAETLAIPYKDIDNADIRKTVGDALDSTDSEYVVKTEIHALFEVLQLLNIETLDNVVIDLDLTNYYDPEPRDTLMASASVHLEISNQLFGIGAETLAIPYKDIDNADIRKTVGDALDSTDSEYVVKTEIHALFEVLQLLNIETLDNVAIDLDLTNYYDPEPREILMGSAAVHAEITRQVLDIDDATLDMPFYNESGSSIRVTRGVGLEATEYLVNDEIHALFEVLEFLGISDFDNVNMDMDLSDLYIVENRNILLASAAVHLKVSSQMLELSTRDVPVIVVPGKDVNDQSITVLRANHVDLIDDIFLKEQEIHYFFEGLEILDLPIDNINQFDGSFDLTVLYDYDNRVELLKSATMHATISDQLIKLDTDSNVIIVPEIDVAETEIIRTVETVLFLMDYEIHDFFEGIEELGLLITDVNDFDGSFDLGVMYVQESRDIILASAALHATISDQLIRLDTEKNVIVMPEKDVASAQIIITRGTTAYLYSSEIDNFFEGLEELGLVISDVNDFDGSFDISVMYEQDSRDIILASAALHATISDQLIKLDTVNNVIIVPAVDIANGEVTRLVETVTFMLSGEIDNFFEGLEELGLLIEDVNEFNGAFDLTKMYEQSSRDIILASATLHATISEQLLDLDTQGFVIVPDSDYIESVVIRVLKGTVEFIDKDEVDHFFDAIEILELPLDDISDFDGSINLGNFFASQEPAEYTNNQNSLLASAIMHATVSDQILGLGSTKLIVPERDLAETLITALVQGTDYVIKDEIKALINALDILGINDITAFAGTITLTNIYSDGNQDTLLLSASMHATISDQILGLGSDKLVVPDKDFAEADIRVTNTVAVEFVVKAEIKALIEALEVLEVTNITGFTGAITLSHFFESANPASYSLNQDTLLASAAMHATISDQVLDLGSSALIVPDTDADSDPIRKTVGTTEFIYKTEIKAIIDSLDVLGLNSIDSMTGAFSLARLDTTAKQDKLLTSASMHATISDKIFAVDDDILYVPEKRQDDMTAVKLQAGLPGDLTDFVTKAEIKALIDALIIMGYGDLSSFTAEFELDQVFANPSTVLLSASIQAMFSNRIINDTAGALQIPDIYYGTTDLIRIILTDVTYIEYDELVALILALDDLELDDFSNFSFTPAVIFELSDFDTILASEIIQATISDNLLASPTLDESAPAGSGKLIVPSFFRQDITVATVSSKQIEVDELDKLLTSLKLLGINNFSDGMSGTSITTIFLNETSRNTFMASGSIHVTTDNLLKGNANISGSVPDLAKETAYGITGVITKAEIINFIVAVNTIGSADFTQANFTVASIAALTPAEQDTILTSMIVRNKITPDLETLCSNPFDPYVLTDDDYMGGVIHDFLKKQSILDIIDHYY